VTVNGSSRFVQSNHLASPQQIFWIWPSPENGAASTLFFAPLLLEASVVNSSIVKRKRCVTYLVQDVELAEELWERSVCGLDATGKVAIEYDGTDGIWGHIPGFEQY